MSVKGARLGTQGEEIATRFLKAKGYRILHRNYRAKSGEIDIIATRKRTTVFIEVKTRSSTLFGSPSHAVTPRKQMQISRVALEYLSRNNMIDTAARFDVIAILLPRRGQPEIEHIPDAFDLSCSS